MNIANKLTLLRIFLIPVFVFLLLWEQGRNPVFRYGALFVFFAGLFDGYAGRLPGKKIPFDYQFREVYGSFGG